MDTVPDPRLRHLDQAWKATVHLQVMQDRALPCMRWLQHTQARPATSSNPALDDTPQDAQPPLPLPPLAAAPNRETEQQATWLAFLRGMPTVRRCQLVQ